MTRAPNHQIQNHAYFEMPYLAPDQYGYLFGYYRQRRQITIDYDGLGMDDGGGTQHHRHRTVPLYLSISGLTSEHEGRDICFTMSNGVTVLPQHRLEWDANNGRWSGIVVLPDGIYRREFASDVTGDDQPDYAPELWVYEDADPRFPVASDCSQPPEVTLEGFDYFIIPEFTEDGYLRDISGMGRHAIVHKLTPGHIVDGPGRGWNKAIRLNAGNTLQRIGCQPCGPMLNTNDWSYGGGPVGITTSDYKMCEFLQIGCYAKVDTSGFPLDNLPNNPLNVLMYWYSPQGTQNGATEAGVWLGWQEHDRLRLRYRAKGDVGGDDDPFPTSQSNKWIGYHLGWRRDDAYFSWYSDDSADGRDGSNIENVELLFNEHFWFGAKGTKPDSETATEFESRTPCDIAFMFRWSSDNGEYRTPQQVTNGFLRMIIRPDDYVTVGSQEAVPTMALISPEMRPMEFHDAALGQTWEVDNNVYYQGEDAPLGTGNLDYYGIHYPQLGGNCDDGGGFIAAECWLGDIGNDAESVFVPSSNFIDQYRDPNYYRVTQPITDFCCALFWRCTGDEDGDPCDDPTELIFVQHLASSKTEGLINEWETGEDADLITWCGECDAAGFLKDVPTTYPPSAP